MDAILYGNLTTNDGYGYCNAWPVSDNIDFSACNECLRVQDMHYLANCKSIPAASKIYTNSMDSLYHTTGGMRTKA